MTGENPANNRQGPRRLAEGRFYEYPLVRLNRDDVGDLMALFDAVSSDPKFVVGNYEVTSSQQLDELVEQHGMWSTSRLNFQSHEPYTHLELSRSKADLWISDSDDLTLLGLERRVSGILARRRGVLRAFRFGWSSLLIAFVGPVPILGIAKLLAELSGEDNDYFYWPLVALLLLYLTASWLLHGVRHSVIYLGEQRGVAGFLKRNADQLILAIISALLVTVGGVVIALAANS